MNKLLPLATLLALAGCAGLSSKEIAKGAKFGSPPHYPQTVTLKVDSFTEKGNFSINANPKLVREAFETILKRERIFREVSADGDYVLTAAIRRIDTRGSGFTAGFNSIIDWSLTPRGSSQKIWQERVTAEGLARLGDALGGNKRYHLAEAWTYSRNIEAAIQKLQESHVLDKN